MKQIVFGIAGQIGSGKSTIAKSLAQVLGCKTASFGAYVRAVARREGFSDDRKTLQDLGQDLLECNGAPSFCIEMLEHQAPDFVPGNALIIDGVRHVIVADALEQLVWPSRFALVYMRVDERIRQQRLETREVKLDDLGKLDAHRTEHDVRRRLRGRADITLVATRPSGELVRAVREWRRVELALPSVSLRGDA